MNKEIENTVQSVKKFATDSYRFLEVCEKPDVTGNILSKYRIQENRSIMCTWICHYGWNRIRS